MKRTAAKPNRALCAALAVCVLLAAGCRGGEREQGYKNGAREGVLTGVWQTEEFSIPDGWLIDPLFEADYDPARGTARFLCSRLVPEVLADGREIMVRERAWITADVSGAEEAAAAEADDGLLTGTFSDGDLVAVAVENAAEYFLVREDLDAPDAEPVLKVGITDAIRGEQTNVQSVTAAPDGTVYVATSEKVVGFDSSFAPVFALDGQSGLRQICVLDDGSLWAAGYFGNGFGIAEIDREKGNLGTVLTLPGGANSLLSAGDGFLASSADGLYRLTPTEEGLREERIGDWMNSDIDPSALLLRAIDDDTLLIAQGAQGQRPALIRRAGDLALADLTTLELAHAFELPPSLRAAITAFNRSRAGSRILISDYTVYDAGDGLGGMERLALDLASGTAHPDILVGIPQASDMEYLVREGLYADLGPRIAKDGPVSADNIFGCVKTAFSDGDGALWGLPLTFSVSTLLGEPGLLGGRAGWTAAEMLDFAEALPADAELFQNMGRERMMNLLGESVYAGFIDQKRGACSFSGPDFIRWLELIKSVPGVRELKFVDEDEAIARRLDGKVALEWAVWYDIDSYLARLAVFSGEPAMIGFPAAKGADGAQIMAQTALLVTSFCSAEQTAWDFLSFCLESGADDGQGFPVLKSSLRELAATCADKVFERSYSGSGGRRTFDPSNPPSEKDLRSPGLLLRFTESDAEALIALFDRIGRPLADRVPSEILAIVDEEISVYLGGGASAEECAKRVQSRAGLWLAEHQ